MEIYGSLEFTNALLAPFLGVRRAIPFLRNATFARSSGNGEARIHAIPRTRQLQQQSVGRGEKSRKFT